MLKKAFFLLALFSFSFASYADEGMWLPLLIKRLNQVDMQKMGLHLTAEEIYSVNHASLKDAIVSLGGFCTGEVISKEGLLLTNYHCAFSSIQSHSTVQTDYITNGFWAATKEDEKPNEGLYARFLVRMEDVTDNILAEVNDTMPEELRAEKIDQAIEKLSAETKGESNNDIEIKSFYGGNEYYLFVYKTYKDVRLVGAPPSAIGKFGGDTDNWMWPRQTGDFALFRVYAGPDGEPAEYSPENIPLKPKYHLPVSLEGVQENDFAMVMGYPGSTDRYLTSFGVNLALRQSNPIRVKIRDKRLSILKQDMEQNEDVRIKYASKYASVSNYWKYYIGQSQGLKKLNVIEDKQQLERQFQHWANQTPERKALYGDVLAQIEKAYNNIEEHNISYIYMLEAAFGTEILPFAYSFSGLYNVLDNKSADQERVNKLVSGLRENTDKYFKNYNASTDQKVLAALLKMYHEDVPVAQQPEIFSSIEKKYKGNFQKWAAELFANSIFDDKKSVEGLLSNPQAKVIRNDPAYQTIQALMDNYYQNVSPKLKGEYAILERADRLFIKGLREMNPDINYYPDANSTMRLTFGKVVSYEPRDGVLYKYYTTLDGVMEKEDPENEEFIVPEKLKTLYKNKDYGPYGENGEMKVAFITNNDITGGNSGSPVINADGALIGIAFDGNWEAMSGDIAFEPTLQRCINVDIRYVLFIIDKFANAKHLVDEMTLVQASAKTESAQQPLPEQ